MTCLVEVKRILTSYVVVDADTFEEAEDRARELCKEDDVSVMHGNQWFEFRTKCVG